MKCPLEVRCHLRPVDSFVLNQVVRVLARAFLSGWLLFLAFSWRQLFLSWLRALLLASFCPNKEALPREMLFPSLGQG